MEPHGCVALSLREKLAHSYWLCTEVRQYWAVSSPRTGDKHFLCYSDIVTEYSITISFILQELYWTYPALLWLIGQVDLLCISFSYVLTAPSVVLRTHIS